MLGREIRELFKDHLPLGAFRLACQGDVELHLWIECAPDLHHFVTLRQGFCGGLQQKDPLVQETVESGVAAPRQGGIQSVQVGNDRALRGSEDRLDKVILERDLRLVPAQHRGQAQEIQRRDDLALSVGSPRPEKIVLSRGADGQRRAQAGQIYPREGFVVQDAEADAAN